MKRTVIWTVVLACSLLLSSFLNFSCQKKGPGWKGTIERRGGLIIVKNPKSPFYGPEIFRLKKDLSIGKAEGEKEYVFSRVGGIDVDSDGNIYAIDGAEAHVRVFDGNGKYLRTIGRKGQGPGETEMPVFVQITSQNEVFVYDYATSRAIFYSPDGTYLRQKKSRGLPQQPLKLDSHGHLIGVEILAPPPLGGKLLKSYDSDLNPTMVIAKEEQGKRQVFDIGKPLCYCCVTSSDNIVWGNSGEYVLHVLNSRGEPIKTIEKAYDPVPITLKDKDAYKKKYEDALRIGYKLSFYDHFPAYGGIFADDGERIFIRTYEHVEGTADSFYYDVFDPEGRYIAKLPIKANLNEKSVWKNHQLYTIESDEEGFPIINRYDIIWKQ